MGVQTEALDVSGVPLALAPDSGKTEAQGSCLASSFHRVTPIPRPIRSPRRCTAQNSTARRTPTASCSTRSTLRRREGQGLGGGFTASSLCVISSSPGEACDSGVNLTARLVTLSPRSARAQVLEIVGYRAGSQGPPARPPCIHSKLTRSFLMTERRHVF